MTKKIVSTVLIPLLLLQLYSCYSMKGISRGELVTQGEQKDVRITTTKFEIFEFKSFNYSIKSDTLYGTGEKIINEHTTVPFSGKIAVSDIEYVETSKFNGGTTCLAGIGAALIVAIVYLALIMKSFNDSLNGCNQKS